MIRGYPKGPDSVAYRAASDMSVELQRLIELAKSHVMTPAERREQRRSWVRGNMMLDHPEMTAERVNRILDEIEGSGGLSRCAATSPALHSR